MKPYYEHGGITIYHGDCTDVLPAIEPGVIVTDPPYGLTLNSRNKNQSRLSVEGVVGEIVGAIPKMGSAIIWGGNLFRSLPTSTRWCIWDKTHPECSPTSQAELAWSNCVHGIRLHREAYHGFMRKRDGWLHPTQKPTGLMSWCLTLPGVPMGGVVVDPFMGSGATLVAAKRLGRLAVGVEVEERYCEIAAKRLDQDVLPIFDAVEPEAEQADLL